MSKDKPSDKLRDMEKPSVFGYQLDRDTLLPVRKAIDLSKAGDFGANPLGNGQFRMIPSGDIVSTDERNRRLNQ